jgi:hypothetical protein
MKLTKERWNEENWQHNGCLCNIFTSYNTILTFRICKASIRHLILVQIIYMWTNNIISITS